jgi:hypothetical protein
MLAPRQVDRHNAATARQRSICVHTHETGPPERWLVRRWNSRGACARIVRFDDADVASDIQGVALENTPSNLVTYPTGVTINAEGYLIVISYDNAHAFVSLELPGGGFFDDGLQDLNVNAGNYGVAVAHETIWFTRANNSNGALRAVTPYRDSVPSTAGPFPPQ